MVHLPLFLLSLTIFDYTQSREMHPILPDSEKCFDTYTDVQPINLSNLTKTCVETLSEAYNCRGLALVSNEILLLECNETDGGDVATPPKGCYRLLKRDGGEGVVCQRFKRRNLCEVIKTPANLAIEVYCDRSARGIVTVKQLKLV
ncbi:unnamed protein product [Phyllotreta striolata]|uniref:Uncharacterized protein n=1 Tax=Phyllotreta striolata TaxID=444603 RepID=A0A9N9TTZ1_PHYSR|nr:unnamed protein product [Phyllotreta striolata]